MTSLISAEQRRQLLLAQVSMYLNQGWEIQTQTDFAVVLVSKPKPINHILHLLLSICTAGFWIIVWIILGISSSSVTHNTIISISESGIVTVSEPGKVATTATVQNSAVEVINGFNERMNKLDSLLQRGLIDAEEYRQRKIQIDQERKAFTQHQKQDQISTNAKPYAMQLHVLQLLRNRDMISQQVFAQERQNVLRRLIS